MPLNEEPHLVTSDNMMGAPYTYWQLYRRTTDGSITVGVGATAEQATREAEKSYQHYEEYLRKSPEERLKQLLVKDRLLDKDQVDAIKLIGGLLLTHLKGGQHG